MQPIRNPNQSWGANKFSKKIDNKQFEKVNADILKNYHERIRGNEELTIIEVGDPRETIEKSKKEFEKGQKEIGLDEADLPKNETVLELLKQMELEENATEKEQPLPQEPIGLQPMEEVVQEVPPSTEKEIAEPLSKMDEEFIEKTSKLEIPVDSLKLEFNFPVKNVITTSGEGKMKENVIKYARVRFIFKDEVSITIELDTTYTSKPFQKEENVDGIIRKVTKQRVFGNTKYFIRIWHDDEFENLQNDVIWAKNHQSFQGELVSGSKQTVYIKKDISQKYKFIDFSIYIQNTINKKEVTDEASLELLNQLYNKVRFTDMIYRRGKDIDRMIQEKISIRGYISSEASLLNYIKMCIGDLGKKYKTVADYIAYLEEHRNDEIYKNFYENQGIEDTEGLSDLEWALETLKLLFNVSDDLNPLQKLEARNLVDEYKMENPGIGQREIDAFDAEIRKFESQIRELKGLEGEVREDDFEEKEDDSPEIIEMKQKYREFVEGLERKKQDIIRSKNYLEYLDKSAIMGQQDDFIRKQRNDIFKLEHAIQGTVKSEQIHGFKVELKTYKDHNKEMLGVHFQFETENQKNKIEEIFNKKMVAIAIHTDKYPPNMQVLSDQRQKELEEYFATHNKS